MIKIILLVVLLAVAVLAFATLEQRTLYFPDKTLIAIPAAYRLPYEDVALKTQDGVSIHGWWLPGKGKPTKTLLFFHGNAGNISHRLDKLQKLHALGLNVLILDYHGYGLSKGKPSEQGTYQDGEAAYAYLTRERKISTSQIIFYGESLGCAVAVQMATKFSAGGMILESPFTSTIAMGKLVFPWLPVQWMVRYRYDNLTKIANIRVPLLILHSPHDEVVPFAMAQQLYAAAPGPKTFFELQGGHNDGYDVTGLGYEQALKDFLWARKRQEKISAPDVSAQALEAHVRLLSEKFIPRDCDHVQNLDRTADYIRESLKKSGGLVSDQVFETSMFNQKNKRITLGPYRNVIARFGPETGERIVMGAHYDAAGPYPAADDNASGVATLLELAKLLGQHPPTIRTDLVAYTLEEPPYFGSDQMGSAIHAAVLAKEGVRLRFMISLETVGYYTDQPKSQNYPIGLMKLFYPTRGNFLAVAGKLGHGGLSRKLIKRMRQVSALPIRSLNAPAFVPGVDFSDHRNYWKHQFPALMLTDTAFYRNLHYHTSQDTPEKLDYPKMAEVVKMTYAMIQGEK